MNLNPSFTAWLRRLCLVGLLTVLPAFAAAETIVSTTPMQLVTEGAGVHGQLVIAQEIVSPETSGDLIYTITVEPRYGWVGLAGGEAEDFFQNKTSRLGYFAYQPRRITWAKTPSPTPCATRPPAWCSRTRS
jgi:hypothetical protein